MPVIIDLDPNLGIQSEEFAAAWNASATASQLARADKDDAVPKSFDTVTTTVVLTALATGLVTLGLNVLEEAIKDVLKTIGKDKPPAGETLFIPDNAKIERIRNHDGSEIITVTIPPQTPLESR